MAHLVALTSLLITLLATGTVNATTLAITSGSLGAAQVNGFDVCGDVFGGIECRPSAWGIERDLTHSSAELFDADFIFTHDPLTLVTNRLGPPVSQPFTMTGHLFESDPFGRQTVKFDLIGQGIMSAAWNQVPGFGLSFAVAYEFKVPEPISLLLVAFGGAVTLALTSKTDEKE